MPQPRRHPRHAAEVCFQEKSVLNLEGVLWPELHNRWIKHPVTVAATLRRSCWEMLVRPPPLPPHHGPAALQRLIVVTTRHLFSFNSTLSPILIIIFSTDKHMQGYNADIHHAPSDLAAFSPHNRTSFSRSGTEATREEEDEGGTEQEQSKYGMPSLGSGHVTGTAATLTHSSREEYIRA